MIWLSDIFDALEKILVDIKVPVGSDIEVNGITVFIFFCVSFVVIKIVKELWGLRKRQDGSDL